MYYSIPALIMAMLFGIILIFCTNANFRSELGFRRKSPRSANTAVASEQRRHQEALDRDVLFERMIKARAAAAADLTAAKQAEIENIDTERAAAERLASKLAAAKELAAIRAQMKAFTDADADAAERNEVKRLASWRARILAKHGPDVLSQLETDSEIVKHFTSKTFPTNFSRYSVDQVRQVSEYTTSRNRLRAYEAWWV